MNTKIKNKQQSIESTYDRISRISRKIFQEYLEEDERTRETCILDLSE